MAFAFEKLLVYQTSVDFADSVCDLTEQFPVRYNHLADQVNRAKLVSDELHAKLKADLEEISSMLSGLINGLDNRET